MKKLFGVDEKDSKYFNIWSKSKDSHWICYATFQRCKFSNKVTFIVQQIKQRINCLLTQLNLAELIEICRNILALLNFYFFIFIARIEATLWLLMNEGKQGCEEILKSLSFSNDDKKYFIRFEIVSIYFYCFIVTRNISFQWPYIKYMEFNGKIALRLNLSQTFRFE